MMEDYINNEEKNMQDQNIQKSKSNFRISYLAIGIITLVLFVVFCVRIIGVGEVGVVTRLGNVNRELNSGVHLKLPWPVESLNKFDVKTNKEQADAAAATKDLQDVTTTLVVNYNLEPGKVNELFRTVGTDWKKRIVEPAIQESVKAVSARYTASELITNRAAVKKDVTDTLADRLAKNGIRVSDVSVTNFKFSPAFSASIEQKQVAQQNAERASFELESARKQAEAQAVQKASLTPEILQRMAIEKWNGVMPQYLGGGAVFNIPLVK